MSASWVVKIVMLGLLAASIWCWAIIIDRSLLFTRAGREMDRFERKIERLLSNGRQRYALVLMTIVPIPRVTAAIAPKPCSNSSPILRTTRSMIRAGITAPKMPSSQTTGTSRSTEESTCSAIAWL